MPSSTFTDALLADRHRLRLFALKLCRNGPDADDMVQETCLQALLIADTFEPGTSMKAWLNTILYRKWIDVCRKRRREESLDRRSEDQKSTDRMHAALFAFPATQDANVEVRETGEALDRMGRSYPAYRQAIVRQAIDEEPQANLALEYGCAVGTLKSRLSRARAELTKLTT